MGEEMEGFEVDGVDKRRCRRLNESALKGEGPVIYWMSRDQRCEDNWALLYAQRLAKKRAVPLHVAFCLVPKFLDATIRHFDFMLRGLCEVEAGLRDVGIPFHLRIGQAVDQVPKMCAELDAAAVVCDMSPLRVPQEWAQKVAKACLSKDIPVIQVDAHNVVPVWAASDKQEYAARTIRKKITLGMQVWLTDFPSLEKHPHAPEEAAWPKPIDWEAAEKSLEVDRSVKPVADFTPGMAAARKRLEDFCKERLELFSDKRNDPNVNALSGLSPYLHFGQLAAQRCALRVREVGEAGGAAMKKGAESYIEEAVVRRELSDNFCFYNPLYDVIEGAPNWAQISLAEHSGDKRDHVYTREQLEAAQTHDDLWNASQLQMVCEGKMHGFLRMYWAKKILEWTPSAQEALSTAIYLNDRYNLDGRDPNGYVGCMWSICGVHDQGWAERKVFGKIRYMNYAGCKRKLDIPKFVAKYPEASKGLAASAEPPKKRAKKA